jgi:hypothetical protein
MTESSEVNVEAELVKIPHEQISERVLQIIITNSSNSTRTVTKIGVRQNTGVTVELTTPGDRHNLLPLVIRSRETKTIEGLSHSSITEKGALIVIVDDLNHECTSPIKRVG